MKVPWHRLSRVHRDILIFTSSAFKTWGLRANTFYSWILLYILPVTAVNISILSVPLYITHLLQLCYDTHVSLCTNLLGTFPVYSLTIWEWRLSLRPGRIWSDICRTIWSDICRCEVRQNPLSDLSVWSLIHLEGSVAIAEHAHVVVVENGRCNTSHSQRVEQAFYTKYTGK